ncbi:MAG: hypothetical protein HS105_02905 [Chloracidobacterium sp.]|nr:hypothetical protein [Chloracidobacterium sp.]
MDLRLIAFCRMPHYEKQQQRQADGQGCRGYGRYAVIHIVLASGGLATEVDQFGVENLEKISNDAVQIATGGILCPVRTSKLLSNLDIALERAQESRNALIILNIKHFRGPFSGYADVQNAHLFTNTEQKLFTKVVAHAERFGEHADLLIVPALDIFHGVARTAADRQVNEIILGRLATISAEKQIQGLRRVWTLIPHRRLGAVKVMVVDEGAVICEEELSADLSKRNRRGTSS